MSCGFCCSVQKILVLSLAGFGWKMPYHAGHCIYQIKEFLSEEEVKAGRTSKDLMIFFSSFSSMVAHR